MRLNGFPNPVGAAAVSNSLLAVAHDLRSDGMTRLFNAALQPTAARDVSPFSHHPFRYSSPARRPHVVPPRINRDALLLVHSDRPARDRAAPVRGHPSSPLRSRRRPRSRRALSRVTLPLPREYPGKGCLSFFALSRKKSEIGSLSGGAWIGGSWRVASMALVGAGSIEGRPMRGEDEQVFASPLTCRLAFRPPATRWYALRAGGCSLHQESADDE